MKITFCIHGCATKPIGGHKILYELANRLVRNGHCVTIVFTSQDNLRQLHLPMKCRVLICRILTFFCILPPWFKFDKKINKKTVSSFDSHNFPDSDIVVATSNNTAEPIFLLPKSKGRKVYFIQGYEKWNMSEQQLLLTYKMGMKNITISKWLQKVVQEYDIGQTEYVSNAIDTDVFKVLSAIKERKQHIVGLLYHEDINKGLKYSIKALDIVKKRFPDLKVLVFGTPNRPENLPEWYLYNRKVKPKELCKIYNECSVFLCASIEEGFGLTGAESMACGCALVSTNYLGVLEYAIDKKNALLSNIGDSQSLADNIMNLFLDDELRVKIAEEGCKTISERTWENAVQQIEKIFIDL